jgi:hypothetical protein
LRKLLVSPVIFALSIPLSFAFGAVLELYFSIIDRPVSRIIGRYEPRVARN